eukprot:8667697-Alexandrium_andersonii.AAC.1
MRGLAACAMILCIRLFPSIPADRAACVVRVRQQQWHGSSIGAESCSSTMIAPSGAPELAAVRRRSRKRRQS